MTTDRENALRTASPEAVRLYRSLRAALRPIGAFREEVKKTSVHLVRGSAFVGVHFRSSHLLVTIKAAAPIDSPRIVKVEQVSKNRWHCEVKVSAETEIDSDLTAWMRAAYNICA
jgi:hypothetical protein